MVNNGCIYSTRTLKPEILQYALDAGVALEMDDFIGIQPALNLEEELTELTRLENIDVAFTSANAVNNVKSAMGDAQPAWRIYCIDGATSAAVTAGFPSSIIVATAKNASELAGKITGQAEKMIYFFCGNRRLEVLPTTLKNVGINVREIVSYAAFDTPKYCTTQYDIIIFYSPSGVNSFLTMNTILPDTTIFVSGETTKNALNSVHNKNSIILASETTKERIALEAINYLANKKDKLEKRFID